MSQRKTVQRILESIPGDEWFSSSSEESYESLIKEMLILGIDEEKVEDILTVAYQAAANEYGG